MLDEDSPLFKGLLIKGMCKILLNNKETLKFCRVEAKELIAIMIIFWHDKNLRDDTTDVT